MSDSERWERFCKLAELEPRLMDLYREAQAMKDDGGASFCANLIWYGYSGHPGLKQKLTGLVGYDAGRPSPKPAPMGIADCRGMQVYTMADLVARTAEEGPPNPVAPELATEQAYDDAYEVIYETLPDCRNCGCFWPGDA